MYERERGPRQCKKAMKNDIGGLWTSSHLVSLLKCELIWEFLFNFIYIFGVGMLLGQ